MGWRKTIASARSSALSYPLVVRRWVRFFGGATLVWLSWTSIAEAASRTSSTPALDREAAAFEQRVEEELRAINPDAVPALQEAEAAREAERYSLAIEGYDRVLELAPGFHHALRRNCASKSRIGEHDAAIALCEEALAAAKTPDNQVVLASVLLEQESVSDSDGLRAIALVSEAARAEPDSPQTQVIAATVALHQRDLTLLKQATTRLLGTAPDDAPTHMFHALSLAANGKMKKAEAALERARSLGLEEPIYQELKAAFASARPLWQHVLIAGAKVGGVWLAIAGLLIVLGIALSRATLAAALRLPKDASATGTGGAGLRRAYAALLWLCCLFYYLSIPLVVLLVLGLGGGIILGFLMLGYIPIKLVAIIAIVTLVTIGVVLKNVFVRVQEHDPGHELEPGEHPRLRALLDEIAGVIGTRSVDRVFLTPDADVAVLERGGLIQQIRGKTERCLVLGVAVLEGMKIGPLSSVLAHEYGHFSNRDTAGGSFALAVRRSLVSTATGIAESGYANWMNPAWVFLNVFHRVFLRVSQGASRLQEIMADRWATRAYGPELFEAGLRHVIERNVVFDVHANTVLKEVIENERPLRNLYTYTPAETPELDVPELVKLTMEAEPSPFDSHPRPVDRIAWVQPIQGPSAPPENATDPAWSLFEDRAAVERLLTAHVRMNVANSLGYRILEDAPEEQEEQEEQEKQEKSETSEASSDDETATA